MTPLKLIVIRNILIRVREKGSEGKHEDEG